VSSATRDRNGGAGTIAHQIGHFVPRTHDRAQCATKDLAVIRTKDALKMREAEANRFAVELLMPEISFGKDVGRLGLPDLEHIGELADRYGVSREAAARRYASLSDHRLAIIFPKDGRCRYSVRSSLFPRLEIGAGDLLPGSISARAGGVSSGTMLGWVDAEPSEWVSGMRPRVELTEHTLVQGRGFMITMLVLEGGADRDMAKTTSRSAHPAFTDRSVDVRTTRAERTQLCPLFWAARCHQPPWRRFPRWVRWCFAEKRPAMENVRIAEVGVFPDVLGRPLRGEPPDGFCWRTLFSCNAACGW
jgi:hypothetical protein